MASQTTPAAAPRAATGISHRLVLVLALACGLTVANDYYAQPLLATIAHDFHTSAGVAGLIVTVTQAGYALGLMLVVPLGDLIERRLLVVGSLLLTTCALVAAALAPSIGALGAAAVVIGVTTVVAQVLVPMSATLAGPDERGRVVGVVMSGLLLGILLARTVAGLVAQFAGWRSIYWVAAALMLALAAILRHELPESRERTGLSYRSLLRSVLTLLGEEPVLRWRAAIGFVNFAAFSVLWTSIAFLLSRPPYGYSNAAIGLFGLVGAAGALSASFAGRFHDRGWSRPATGILLATGVISFVLIGIGGHSLLALIVGLLLMDLGVQGTHILNQGAIYALRDDARSRLTTAYMTSNFIGGAIGSASSALAYQAGGWWAVAVLGGGYIAVGLLLWALQWAAASAGERRAAASTVR